MPVRADKEETTTSSVELMSEDAVAFSARLTAAARPIESRPRIGHNPPIAEVTTVRADKEETTIKSVELTSEDIVAFSARLIAAARAIESRREDRLFHDPFAERLAGREAMREWEDRGCSREGDGEGSSDSSPSGEESHCAKLPLNFQNLQPTRGLSIRTRFLDDFFEDCTMSRGIKQVVLLGAGMDTRGLRLKAPEDAKVFEVDQPVVMRVKRDLLSGPKSDVGADGDSVGLAEVIGIEADLSVDGWQGKLLEAGFDPNSPSAWILEGLVMYIEKPDVEAMLRIINDLCSPGSGICVTFVRTRVLTLGGAYPKDMLWSRFKFGTDDPQGFIEAQFPDYWTFKSVRLGTPGRYPNGADYGVGFAKKAAPLTFGFYTPEELFRG